MKGKDIFEIDINKWDGANNPCIEDDDDENGFSDENCGDDGDGVDSTDDDGFAFQKMLGLKGKTFESQLLSAFSSN
jgi:hypothetical protein